MKRMLVPALALLSACASPPPATDAALMRRVDEALKVQREEILKEVRSLLDERSAGGPPMQMPPGGPGGFGGKAPGFLGIRPSEVEGGVQLDDLMPDGPAEKGGLRKEDIIIAVGGKKIATLQDLMMALVEAGENGKVKFSVKRGGETRDLELTLGGRPEGGGPPMEESEEDE